MAKRSKTTSDKPAYDMPNMTAVQDESRPYTDPQAGYPFRGGVPAGAAGGPGADKGVSLQVGIATYGRRPRTSKPANTRTKPSTTMPTAMSEKETNAR